jgi:hypothetical protein
MGRKSKAVNDIGTLFEVTKSFDLVLLDLGKSGVNPDSKAFDCSLWEMANTLDYDVVAAILSVFAGKTIKFPTFKEIDHSCLKAACLADHERGMDIDALAAKYGKSFGGKAAMRNMLERMKRLRSLGERWKETFDQLTDILESTHDEVTNDDA